MNRDPLSAMLIKKLSLNGTGDISLSNDDLTHPFLKKYIPDEKIRDLYQELIKSSFLQRLHGIDQSGPLHFFGNNPLPAYSRLVHSIGVAKIVQMQNGSPEEQLTALLHDASHTVGSHAGDYLFGKIDGRKAYQDEVHMSILEKSDIKEILNAHEIEIDVLNPDRAEYRRLEQPLPDLCADRIEYNLHTAVILKKITPEEARRILSNIQYDPIHERYGINLANIESAIKIGELSCDFTENLWGTPKNYVCNLTFAQLLKRGLELELYSLDDLHFKTDTDILNRIYSYQDATTTALLYKLNDIEKYFQSESRKRTLHHYGEKMHFYRPKFRGIDPWIYCDDYTARTTFLNPNYHIRYQKLKNSCENGFNIIDRLSDYRPFLPT
jgi:HD superfamily phosphohydrolase